MLQDAREQKDFVAVICDDLDRFSRAEVMEVFADLSALAAAGIKTIHCVNQGEYGLGENDIGRIIKMVVDVHGGNDFSRKLSRRVALAHRNRAKLAKRAGVAPYGLANDGKAGLKHGDPRKLKIVRRIFDNFVRRKMSMNSIAAELNREGIPSSRGRKWYVAGVRELLQRTAYRGDFTFGLRQEGRFFITGKDGEVVEAGHRAGHRWTKGQPTFRTEGAYKPVVDPKIWDAAQERIASFSLKGSRPRNNGYPLTGILICAKCGKPMYGCHPQGRHRVYRCSTPAKTGTGTCGPFEIRESLILPQVMKLVSDEIDDLSKLLAAPPDSVRSPRRAKNEEREALQNDRAALIDKIDKAVDNLLESDDPRTRQHCDRRITAMRDEVQRIDASLATAATGEAVKPYGKEELAALRQWWAQYTEKAVRVPVSGKAQREAASCSRGLLPSPRGRRSGAVGRTSSSQRSAPRDWR